MLQKNNRRKFRAFTIMDLLLGVVILALAVIVAINAYTMISQLWRENLVMNELSISANVAIEKMIHGNSGNTGLLAAKHILAPLLGFSANSVDYTDAFDLQRRFYYSEGKIYAEDGKLIISNIDGDAVAISNIFLNIDDRVVQIALALKKTVGKKEVKLRVETRVRLRN